MKPVTEKLAQELIDHIHTMIINANLNNNSFYQRFQSSTVSKAGLKEIFQQYYYYIRTFPQILAGLAHRVENELIRKKLARTVVSELGDRAGKPHFVMFEDVLSSVGVTLDDYKTAQHIPEAEALVSGLRQLFLVEEPNYALGAHFVIELIGLPMIVALYEGFRQYPGWKVEDYSYFYLHLLVECEHVDWIQDAVKVAISDIQSKEQIKAGAQSVIHLLHQFWLGLDHIMRRYQTLENIPHTVVA